MATSTVIDPARARPRVEFFEDEYGRIESAYVTLREARAVSAVRPDPDHLVFIYVGDDERPVGVRLLEPVTGVAATDVVVRLAHGGGGTRPGGETLGSGAWLPIEDVDATIHVLQEASRGLQGIAD